MKALKTILAWIFSIILAVSLFGLFMIANISSFCTTENIQKATAQIDVSHEISKMQNSTNAGHKAEISDIVTTAYEEAENHGISSDLVDEIFNSEEVKIFLGQIIGNTTDYLINGTENKIVTSEDFNKLLDDNMDKWIKNSGISISDSKKEVLVIRMKSASAGIIDNLPTPQTLSSNFTQDSLDKMQQLFSPTFKTTLVIICAFSLIMLLILKHRYHKWLLYVAVPTIIIGLLTVATSFVIVDVLAMLLNQYCLSFMVSIFSDGLAHSIFITGLIAIIIAIIIFIIYGLMGKKGQKKTPTGV